MMELKTIKEAKEKFEKAELPKGARMISKSGRTLIFDGAFFFDEETHKRHCFICEEQNNDR
jgi:hypothetical protein